MLHLGRSASSPLGRLVVPLLLLSACGHQRPGTVRQVPPVGDVSGTWEGSFEQALTSTERGTPDRQVERHTWRLQQNGEQVRGVLFVEITLTSGDGRPYLCSGRTKLTAWLTSEVVGRRRGDHLELREDKAPHVDGPCQPPPRDRSAFEGRLDGDALVSTARGPLRRLVRRQTAAATPLDPRATERVPALTSLSLVGPSRAPLSGPAELHGHWVWEQQAALPNGDAKREREEWHLVQEGKELVGFYDRFVEQRSTDGRLYRCNNALDFRSVTRYEVRGVVSGPRFVISEQTFEVLEGGPCDDGQRQLDSYEGEAREGELVLTFGVGQQVLRRARPNVPTQAF